MKNTFLNIMAFITAACMVTITVFVILTAGAVKENSEKSLSKISDIEEQITAINERYEEEESASGNATYDTVNPEDVEDMADAVNALAQAVAALQEQTNNMASVDFETLNQAIQTLDETANSLESTAGRISAIFG
ncbi:MAG: hypothetical protein K6A37_05905 [Saccharofermentans sp.]|jgi:uncharacterized protein YoxC|nr:hypothetical protein [Clostridiales bacterium]MBR4494989.1 hypothetical protein [Clostridiales bacterium]MCR5048476.1 hypothetical protein [Saccharofermentans sp.]